MAWNEAASGPFGTGQPPQAHEGPAQANHSLLLVPPPVCTRLKRTMPPSLSLGACASPQSGSLMLSAWAEDPMPVLLPGHPPKPGTPRGSGDLMSEYSTIPAVLKGNLYQAPLPTASPSYSSPTYPPIPIY